MIPRYRGRVTGGRARDHRRRHRLAILIELARFVSSLVLLYVALVCAIGVGLWVSNTFYRDLSDTVARIPVLRQLAVQSDIIGSYGDALLAAGLAAALVLLIAVHFIANLLIDDLVDR